MNRMTAPRVNVPVEPTEAMLDSWHKAVESGIFSQTPHSDYMRSAYRAMLSAAPAPEGGAVDDLIDRFATALKEKLHYAEAKYGHNDAWMRDDWQGDLVKQLSEHVAKGDPRDVAAYCAFAWHHGWSLALATREEAPAEAGERDVIAREVWIGFTGNQNAWDRAKDTDNETAKYCWATADRILALRAQPQAREEAQPVGWISEAVLHRMGRMDHEMIYGDKKAADYQGDAVAVYTTPPAPEAEKLRVALREIKKLPTSQLHKARTIALAALQAEQKGGV